MSGTKKIQGIIPLFILILVGVVVVAAGGAYIVRNQFVKPPDSENEKASLDIPAIEEQVESPQELPELDTEPDGIPAPLVYNYAPETGDDETTSSVEEPAFTINPPAGWLQSSSYPFTVVFQSPEKDSEEVEEPLIFNQPASVQVEMHYAENASSYQFQAVVADYLANRYAGANFLTNTEITHNGQQAQKLEMILRSSDVGVDMHIYEIFFVKNDHLVNVRGVVIDSSWDKRAGAVRSSVDSFSFN